MNEHGEIILYQSEDGLTKLDVNLQKDTVWLSLDQMAELFGRDKSTISRHLRNVFVEGELSESATVAKFATVQTEGERQVSRDINYYNLDAIISVGYRALEGVHDQRLRAGRRAAEGPWRRGLLERTP